MAGKRKRTSRTLREAAVTGRESRCRPPRRRRALIAVISLLLPLSAMGALMVRRCLAPPKSSSGSAPTREVAAPSSAQIRTQSAPPLSKEYIYRFKAYSR
jgi:hypothetical protein